MSTGIITFVFDLILVIEFVMSLFTMFPNLCFSAMTEEGSLSFSIMNCTLKFHSALDSTYFYMSSENYSGLNYSAVVKKVPSLMSEMSLN